MSAALMTTIIFIVILVFMLLLAPMRNIAILNDAKCKKINIGITAILLVNITLIVSICFIHTDGLKRGMTSDDWDNYSIFEIIETNQNTPISEEVSLDDDGAIVILYKYGCPDCEAIYDELNDFLTDADIDNVYFVASSSESGETLIEEGQITSVPSAIYIRHEALSNGSTINWVSITTTDSDSNVSFDSTVLEYLIRLQLNEA